MVLRQTDQYLLHTKSLHDSEYKTNTHGGGGGGGLFALSDYNARRMLTT